MTAGSQNSVQPITPDEVVQCKAKVLPGAVIQVFNDLIAKHWNGHGARFTQDEAAALIASSLDVPRQEVFDNRWLDVEEVFRAVGWHVEYDSPGYNESYKATFAFRMKS